MSAPGRQDASGGELTLVLLDRARAGDAAALEELMTRYRARLRRWAHRRLPDWARDATDTDDLVQSVLLNTLQNLHGFKAESEVGFHYYLRRAVANAIRDQVRRVGIRPPAGPLPPQLQASTLSEGQQRQWDRYERALEQLSPEEREAVIARLEWGLTHGELAAALGKRTPDAARKLCRRALTRLADFIAEESRAR